MRFAVFFLLFSLALVLSAVEGFLPVAIRKHTPVALTVTKQEMMDAPSQPTSKPSSGTAKPLGKKGKRKAKSAAAAAIADAINGKPPKKRVA